MRAVWECVPRGIKALGFPGIVTAYIKTYNPRSYAGARASASRLMRHPHVRPAMQWFYAQLRKEIARGEPNAEDSNGDLVASTRTQNLMVRGTRAKGNKSMLSLNRSMPGGREGDASSPGFEMGLFAAGWRATRNPC
jgi:hypothetical protein